MNKLKIIRSINWKNKKLQKRLKIHFIINLILITIITILLWT